MCLFISLIFYHFACFFIKQKEVEEALEQVCSLIPSNLQSECKQFVDTYTPQILDLLSQKLSPEFICGSLGLCPSILNKVNCICR